MNARRVVDREGADEVVEMGGGAGGPPFEI
jgi:hypothetical protein